MQAAIVRIDDGVGEPGADRIAGLADALGQQPGRAQFTARFLVIGEVQFDGSGERRRRSLSANSAQV
jgi:hypothetical protein